jgi:hypothetical protein
MKGNGYSRKSANTWLMAGAYLALVMIMALCVQESALCASGNDAETKAVLQAARNFLNAEVRRDYPAVYACFAPSSPYARTHNYEQYLAEARSAQDRIVKYRIVKVTYILNPEDRKTYPAVDKVAQVEVDLTFSHINSRQRSEINIGFIFLKEGGRWYKS